MATKKSKSTVTWNRTIEDGYVLLRARISNQIELQLCQDMTSEGQALPSWTGYIWPYEAHSGGWRPADAPVHTLPIFGSEERARKRLALETQAFFEAMAAAVASLSSEEV